MTAAIALTRKQWAERINTAWHDLRQSTVEGFFQLGLDLLKAKEEIGHGGFMAMVRDDFEMGQSAANAFMRIARCESVSSAHTLLPPDWTTVDKLTRLDPATFDRLIEDGTINPQLKRNEVAKILRLESVAADERRVLNLAPIPGKFRTLVIDPGWDYEQSLAGRARPLYKTMTHEELLTFDVGQWAEDNCHLYLWTTNNFVLRAGELMTRWGSNTKRS